MKYMIDVSGRKVLLTLEQLNSFIEVMDGAEFLTEKYVGNNAGTQGHNNNYIPVIESKAPHEWLNASIMTDHFCETIKLTMKLHPTT